MTEIKSVSGDQYELIKKTLTVLNKFRKFDTIKVYEGEKSFEVHTINRKEKFVTRTRISKFSWKIIDSVYQRPGEEEVKLK